jgi:hypothetical protein
MPRGGSRGSGIPGRYAGAICPMSDDKFEVATARWVHPWNARRLHGACGDIAPAEFEAEYHQRLQAASEAA